MARIFLDGFEGGDLSQLTSYSGATCVSTAGLGMDGSYCLDCTSITDWASVAFTADDEMYVSFMYRRIPGSGIARIINFISGTTTLAYIKSRQSPLIRWWRNMNTSHMQPVDLQLAGWRG